MIIKIEINTFNSEKSWETTKHTKKLAFISDNNETEQETGCKSSDSSTESQLKTVDW